MEFNPDYRPPRLAAMVAFAAIIAALIPGWTPAAIVVACLATAYCLERSRQRRDGRWIVVSLILTAAITVEICITFFSFLLY